MRNKDVVNGTPHPPVYACANAPEIFEGAYSAGWRYVCVYVPLPRDAAQVRVYDESRDRWLPLERIGELRERPAGATHVVKLTPVCVNLQQLQPGDASRLVDKVLASMSPRFFYASLRTPPDAAPAFLDLLLHGAPTRALHEEK